MSRLTPAELETVRAVADVIVPCALRNRSGGPVLSLGRVLEERHLAAFTLRWMPDPVFLALYLPAHG